MLRAVARSPVQKRRVKKKITAHKGSWGAFRKKCNESGGWEMSLSKAAVKELFARWKSEKRGEIGVKRRPRINSTREMPTQEGIKRL